MKTLYESLLDDEDVLLKNADKSMVKIQKDKIHQWIKSNYQYTGRLSIKENGEKFIVNLTGNLVFKNIRLKSLTNGIFEWGEITGNFRVPNLYITSLEGAPKKVGGDFSCARCHGLTSLEGGPEEVGGNYDCSSCDITSLEGAPKEKGDHFNCCYCKNLTSLKGIPSKLNQLICWDCGKEFNEKELKKYCDCERAFFTYQQLLDRFGGK